MTTSAPAPPAGSAPASTAARARPRRTTGDVVRTVVRGVGQTLITAGVVLLLFCVYELKITNLVTEREQERLTEQLAERWAAPPPPAPAAEAPAPIPVEIGTGIAVLRIPRLGGDWNSTPPVVVEGTDVDALKKGPGRLVESALPGELGNLVISGHRTTYGAPFADVDQLRPGDAIVVETRDSWYTYRVTGTEIVAPTDVEVTLPVPRQPGVAPTGSVLTLTTCHPKYSARQRLIVFSALEQELPKANGAPAALTEV
jgi:sortase A